MAPQQADPGAHGKAQRGCRTLVRTQHTPPGCHHEQRELLGFAQDAERHDERGDTGGGCGARAHTMAPLVNRSESAAAPTRAVAEGADPDVERAADVMTYDVSFAHADDRIERVAAAMIGGEVRHRLEQGSAGEHPRSWHR